MAYDDSDSEEEQQQSLETRTKGLAAAAEIRVAADAPAGVGGAASASHEEAWMINLGRGNDNEWLTGPREDTWYTGIHPRDCPGTYYKGTALCFLCCTEHVSWEAPLDFCCLLGS